jgi:hypothetical protein
MSIELKAHSSPADPSTPVDMILVDGINGAAGAALPPATAGVVVVRLPAGEPGLPHIVQAVRLHPHARELHVVCPGDEGQLLLGTTLVSLELLRADRRTRVAFAEIGRALGPDAVLMLGGANVGFGERGAKFIQLLADLTGMEIGTLVRAWPHPVSWQRRSVHENADRCEPVHNRR